MSAMCASFEEFFNWLTSFAPDDFVGEPGRYFWSPLALFFSEKMRGVIGEDGRKYGRASCDLDFWQPLPRWARLFSQFSERAHPGTISAYEAVAILVEVETVLASPPVLVAV